MKIRITRACTGPGGVSCAVGAVVDATERDARYLVALGKAELAGDTPPPVAEIQTTETAAAIVENEGKRGKRR